MCGGCADAGRTWPSRFRRLLGDFSSARPRELVEYLADNAVVCGQHAFDLAEALTGQIRAVREATGRGGRVCLFMAAPGAFSFFLGQRQTAIGPLTLYEYDFEGEQGGSYQPSLSLPVRA